MPINFKKLENKRKLINKRKNFIVVDKFILTKIWSEKPSYWIEILCDLDGRFLIRKRWSWKSNIEGKIISGEQSSKKFSSKKEINEYVSKTLSIMLDREYKFINRINKKNTPLDLDIFEKLSKSS